MARNNGKLKFKQERLFKFGAIVKFGLQTEIPAMSEENAIAILQSSISDYLTKSFPQTTVTIEVFQNGATERIPDYSEMN